MVTMEVQALDRCPIFNIKRPISKRPSSRRVRRFYPVTRFMKARHLYRQRGGLRSHPLSFGAEFSLIASGPLWAICKSSWTQPV